MKFGTAETSLPLFFVDRCILCGFGYFFNWPSNYSTIAVSLLNCYTCWDLWAKNFDDTEFSLLREAISELEERLERTERAKQSAEQEVECMRACVSCASVICYSSWFELMECSTFKGAYNPDETQVVHLLANPADNMKRSQEREVITLRKENAQLQQRIKVSLSTNKTFDSFKESRFFLVGKHKAFCKS